MTAEEAFAEAYAEAETITGIRLGSNGVEIVRKLRILPADEPKKEASTFGVLLGLLTIGGTMLTLAGMKLFDIFWRLMR